MSESTIQNSEHEQIFCQKIKIRLFLTKSFSKNQENRVCLKLKQRELKLKSKFASKNLPANRTIRITNYLFYSGWKNPETKMITNCKNTKQNAKSTRCEFSSSTPQIFSLTKHISPHKFNDTKQEKINDTSKRRLKQNINQKES